MLERRSLEYAQRMPPALNWLGHAVLALSIAAAPIVLIGGGYDLLVIAMLTFGRDARWN